MKLSEILNGVDYKLVNETDIDISNITYDSRKVEPNSIFFCIQGFITDGSLYINQAIENGAKVIVVENEINLKYNICIAVVKNCRHALAIASSNFYNNPSKSLKLIGVTGTNGKTTTTFLIGNILKYYGYKVGIIGTIENRIDEQVLKSTRTTPESLELQTLFAQMLNQNVNHVVMEVSSHSLALNRVDGCKFDIGIFTNLTQDHLDFHKTIDNYREAKAKLFKMCKKGILNIDDMSSKYIASVASCDIITFSIDNEALFKAENIKLSSKGVSFDVKIDNEYVDFFLPIPGKFNVYNSLSAIAACYIMGIDVNTIKEGLKNIKLISGRCQTIHSSKGFDIIVDYAHTPDGLKNIITTVKEFAKGKTYTIFGCGGDRDKTKRSIMGEIAGNLSDFCIITSDNPRSENPDKIIMDIEAGIAKTNCSYIKIQDRKEAIKYALNIASKDDIIIIAGKGHENYQILKDKTIHFDDVEIVKLLLEE